MHTHSSASAPPVPVAAAPSPRPPKCVVWDLDETIWEGTLLEGDEVRVRAGVREAIEGLDARGILQSIASRNEPEPVLERLRAFDLDGMFLHPQISWGAKSAAVARIADALNIGVDAIVFVDDQAFEREEVAAVLPQVRCVDAAQAGVLLDVLGLRGLAPTGEGRLRRAFYAAEDARRAAEAAFDGPAQAFLETLGMEVRIAPAAADDLERAEELTRRTNQLNSTGVTYSRDELDALRNARDHQLLIVSLDDRFGSYGRVGVALVECRAGARLIKLLLMSCRVMARGTGTIVLHQLMREARQAGDRLLAHFVRTDRNRQMAMTYRFAGFREVGRDGGVQLLEHDLADVPPAPPYVRLVRE